MNIFKPIMQQWNSSPIVYQSTQTQPLEPDAQKIQRYDFTVGEKTVFGSLGFITEALWLFTFPFLAATLPPTEMNKDYMAKLYCILSVSYSYYYGLWAPGLFKKLLISRTYSSSINSIIVNTSVPETLEGGNHIQYKQIGEKERWTKPFIPVYCTIWPKKWWLHS